MAWDKQNAPIVRSAFIATSSTTCDIALGDSGLWNNAGAPTWRNANGTDAAINDAAFPSPTYYRLFNDKAGRATAGAITCTGAKVGDKVIAATASSGTLAGRSSFEATVTVLNQIQQTTATDLSGGTYDFMVLAQS